MGSLVAFLVIFAMWPFALLWRAYVVVVMWGWFLQPYLGLAPSIHTTAGAMMIVALATARAHPDEQEREAAEQVIRAAIYGFVLPLLALGTAWVWKWLQWGLA